MQLVSREHIEIASNVRSDKPCIIGTRIAVEDVALMNLKLGYSLVEIASKYNLSLSSVYAAMAYYFDHHNEIDRRTAGEDKLVEGLRKNYSSRLWKKLRQLRNE